MVWNAKGLKRRNCLWKWWSSSLLVILLLSQAQHVAGAFGGEGCTSKLNNYLFWSKWDNCEKNIKSLVRCSRSNSGVPSSPGKFALRRRGGLTAMMLNDSLIAQPAKVEQRYHYGATVIKGRISRFAFRANNSSLSGGNLRESWTALYRVAVSSAISASTSSQMNASADIATLMDDRVSVPSKPSSEVSRNYRDYHSEILLLSNSGGARQAETILESWLRLYNNNKGRERREKPLFPPNVVSFNAVIDAWARNIERRINLSRQEAARRSIEILREMERSRWIISSNSKGGEARISSEAILPLPEGVRPNVVTYNSVLNVLAKAGDFDIVEKELLRLERLYLERGDESIRPDVRSYTIAISSLAKAGHTRRAGEILHLLENSRWVTSMIDNDSTIPPNLVLPDAIMYKALFNAYAKRSADTAAISRSEAVLDMTVAAEEAEELLRQVEGRYAENEGRDFVEPDLDMYHAVLMTLSSSSLLDGGERALRILRRLEEHSQSALGGRDAGPTVTAGVVPCTYTYNLVMSALAKSGMTGGRDGSGSVNGESAKARAEAVEVILRELEGKAGTVVADEVSYGIAMDAWAQTLSEDGASRVRQLLTRMQDRYNATAGRNSGETSPPKPSVWHFNAILKAWGKRDLSATALSLPSSSYSNSAAKAEKLLRWMANLSEEQKDSSVGPDTTSYNIVIDAWAKSGHPRAAENAEKLLYAMEREYKKGNKRVGPDTVSFNTVITAWAKSGEVGSAQASQDLLERMESLYRVGRTEARPDCISCTSVIDAWAKSGEKGAARRAEEILNMMWAMHDKEGNQQMQPTTVSYNAVLNAFSKSRERDAAERAESILCQMEKRYEQDMLESIKPNLRSYSTVIEAWAKSGSSDAPQRAEALLQKMEKRQRMDSKDTSLKPNSRTFRAIMNAWGRSSHPNKAQIAQSYLHKMEELYLSGHPGVQPNVYAYNAVLNACAYTSTDKTEEMKDAFRIACTTFEELMKSRQVQPNDISYGTFLQVCSRLMSNKNEDDKDSNARDRMVESIFRRCCHDGLVGTLVLKELKDASTPELYRDLLKDLSRRGELTVRDLPARWTRNLKENGRRTRRKSRVFSKPSKFYHKR